MAVNSWLHQLVSGLIVAKLFDPEFKRLLRQEQEMIRENARLGGSTDGFRYMGNVYSCLDPQIRSKGKYVSLTTSLMPAMKALAEDREIVTFDKGRISQALALSLKDCKSPQDIRDALPTSLVDLAPPNVVGLQRTRPEAWTLLDNPRAHAQYIKLREKIDFYAASRLIY